MKTDRQDEQMYALRRDSHDEWYSILPEVVSRSQNSITTQSHSETAQTYVTRPLRYIILTAILIWYSTRVFDIRPIVAAPIIITYSITTFSRKLQLEEPYKDLRHTFLWGLVAGSLMYVTMILYDGSLGASVRDRICQTAYEMDYEGVPLCDVYFAKRQAASQDLVVTYFNQSRTVTEALYPLADCMYRSSQLHDHAFEIQVMRMDTQIAKVRKANFTFDSEPDMMLVYDDLEEQLWEAGKVIYFVCYNTDQDLSWWLYLLKSTEEALQSLNKKKHGGWSTLMKLLRLKQTTWMTVHQNYLRLIARNQMLLHANLVAFDALIPIYHNVSKILTKLETLGYSGEQELRANSGIIWTWFREQQLFKFLRMEGGDICTLDEHLRRMARLYYDMVALLNEMRVTHTEATRGLKDLRSAFHEARLVKIVSPLELSEHIQYVRDAISKVSNAQERIAFMEKLKADEKRERAKSVREHYRRQEDTIS